MSLRMTKAVWKSSKAKGPAKLVLLCLAEHADDDGIAWPSQARLARLCGVDERNIRRALLRLLGLNLIVAVGRGRQGVIVYRIKPDADGQQGAKSSALSPDEIVPPSRSTADEIAPRGRTKSSAQPRAKSSDKPSVEPSLEPSIAAAAKQAVELFNSLAEELGLRPVQRLTDNRLAQLAARLGEVGGFAGWQLALDKIRETPGLHSQAAGGWHITFDWLVSESNFIKIMEGTYDGWDPKSPRNGAGHAGSSSRKRANYDAAFAALAATARGKRDAR